METKFGTAKLYGNYYRISSGKEGNNKKYLHRLIWEDHYGKSVPKGYVVHHLNGDKTDNRIQNLQCVEQKLHRKFHSSNITEETRNQMSKSMSGERNPNYGKVLSDEEKARLAKYSKLPQTEKNIEKISKAKNTTGYFCVTKQKNKQCKQGFIWRYEYSENGKRKTINRTNLDDLEKEVKRRGLKWLKFEED